VASSKNYSVKSLTKSFKQQGLNVLGDTSFSRLANNSKSEMSWLNLLLGDWINIPGGF
jgi:uncharacterized protein (DUF302 family)